MILFSQALVLASSAVGQVRKGRRRARGRWLGEPRNAVLVALAALLLVGGGRKLRRGWRARRAVERLGAPGLTPADVLEVAEFGRDGLIELFRLLGTAELEELRRAAGNALSVIWARDDLIPEEEKALVRRGFDVTWRARKRYPRGLRSPIPIAIIYTVPFLTYGGTGVHPDNLEWSHRILGARRAALEAHSAWKSDLGRAEFTLVPGDFDTNGPHRLTLAARVRTRGLTDAWEIELPQVSFTFEFDPLLQVEALFTLPDEARGAAIARAVRIDPGGADDAQPARYLDLNQEFALRNPPALVVSTPLPCDLAHALALEFEDVPGRFAAGEVIISGQGTRPNEPRVVRRFPFTSLEPLPANALDRPGQRRVRAILTADPDCGWADPDVRSIWPGTIETDWLEVQIVRR